MRARKHVIDRRLSYSENIEGLQAQYPQFQWIPPEKITARTYEKQFIVDIRDQAGQYSYDVIKGSKVKKLEREGRRADQLKIELAECKEAKVIPRVSRPGTCRVKTVRVVDH